MEIIFFSILVVATLMHGAESSKSESERIQDLESKVSSLSRELMLQQFFAEQRVRTEGQSGIKIIRQRKGGTKNYFVESHTGFSSAAVHDHSNNIRTVGMGEFAAVLNGVEFKTRHNDYRLYMPHRTSKHYHKIEPIPFPEVPKEVKDIKDVSGQVEEMREWFKAWRDQNHTVRDYRKYFKPILCYMEGAWTKPGDSIDEPFPSDRHSIDADTWDELHDKVRYVTYSGTKNVLEDLSILPTKIIKLKRDSTPVYAQWNYRILCHPLKKDLPLNRLRMVEDLSSRMMHNRQTCNHLNSRGARFQLNTLDSPKFYDKKYGRGLLDELMEEIPGKDNYQGNLTDEGLDVPALNPDKSTPKDTSRYHRWFSVNRTDAMGASEIHRGFNDEFMFAAMTTQKKVLNVDLRKCPGKTYRRQNKRNCYTLSQRWTYAIPLEIIYLTPLQAWNPYNLKHHGVHAVNRKIAQKGRRSGKCLPGKEYNGTTSKLFYRTPSEFYTGVRGLKDSADTVRKSICVLDRKGKSRSVRASGIHVFLPQIKGVGVLRQRYPIYPVHGEGSSVWKELNALKDIVLNEQKWKHMHRTNDDDKKCKSSEGITLKMGLSSSKKTTPHTHEVELTSEEVFQLKELRQLVTKETTENNGHSHTVTIRWNVKKANFSYIKCDGSKEKLCWDLHRRFFTEE